MSNDGLTLNQLAERNAVLVTEVEKLRAERDQLAAENVALNEKLDKLALWPGIEFYSSSWEFNNNDGNEAIEFMCDIETPATDRIVAGIKADGVDEFAAHLRANDNGTSVCKMIALGADDFAKQLREGADK
ncbi:hypothetical protein [Klebsiella michiganensis]|uniref:hypothetical protein n=1 Tax=Klebsiella michiganensis TaxID=1134687 RepID=UPI003EE322BB